MKVITLSELRKNIEKHFEEVLDSMEIIAVPQNSKNSTKENNEEAVVIMSLKEYNSLQETNYLLSTQANRDNLNESIKQMQKGNTVKFDF